MRSVLVVSPDPSQVCQYYRMAGPLLDSPERYKVAFVHPDEVTWMHFVGMDIVGVCRPDSEQYLRIFKMAKHVGCEIWVDVDDWLLGVPLDNPAFLHYNKPEVQSAVRQCIEQADIFTVSTTELANKFGYVGTKVVRNCHRDNISSVSKANGGNTVYWRGSETHLQDVLPIADGTMLLLNKQKAPLHVFGWTAFPFMEASQEPVEYHPNAPILGYLSELKEIQPALCIVPLRDSPFNRCKSNIAWIEATLSGALTLVPNMPEWDVPGVQLYDPGRRASFYGGLNVLNWDMEARQAFWQQSYEAIFKIKSEAALALEEALS